MTLHPDAERLETLEEKERVQRSDGRADIAQVLKACLQDVLSRAERFGQLREDDPVVARVRFGEIGETTAFHVVELPAVDDDTADGGAVAADELRRRVHGDVRSVEERLAQVRRGHGVVDHERDAVLVGDRRDSLEVEHVALRVADGLGIERLRVGPDRVAPRVQVVGILDEAHLDSELRKV